MQVLAPVRSTKQTEDSGRAPRSGSLDGKRLGLLDNGKPGAGRLIKDLGARLGAEFSNVEIVVTTKEDPNYSHVSTDEELTEMLQCDAVITAMGNCGSCTSSSVLDSLKLESKGVPTALICTTVFEDLASQLSHIQGADWFKVATVPHASQLSNEAVTMWADHALDQVRSILVDQEVAA